MPDVTIHAIREDGHVTVTRQPIELPVTLRVIVETDTRRYVHLFEIDAEGNMGLSVEKDA